MRFHQPVPHHHQPHLRHLTHLGTGQTEVVLEHGLHQGGLPVPDGRSAPNMHAPAGAGFDDGGNVQVAGGLSDLNPLNALTKGLINPQIQNLNKPKTPPDKPQGPAKEQAGPQKTSEAEPDSDSDEGVAAADGGPIPGTAPTQPGGLVDPTAFVGAPYSYDDGGEVDPMMGYGSGPSGSDSLVAHANQVYDQFHTDLMKAWQQEQGQMAGFDDGGDVGDGADGGVTPFMGRDTNAEQIVPDSANAAGNAPTPYGLNPPDRGGGGLYTGPANAPNPRFELGTETNPRPSRGVLQDYAARAQAMPQEEYNAYGKQVDPKGTMDPGERHLRIMGSLADPDKQVGAMMRGADYFDHARAAARALYDAGHPDKAAAMMNEGMKYASRGYGATFTPFDGGIVANTPDTKGPTKLTDQQFGSWLHGDTSTFDAVQSGRSSLAQASQRSSGGAQGPQGPGSNAPAESGAGQPVEKVGPTREQLVGGRDFNVPTPQSPAEAARDRRMKAEDQSFEQAPLVQGKDGVYGRVAGPDYPETINGMPARQRSDLREVNPEEVRRFARQEAFDRAAAGREGPQTEAPISANELPANRVAPEQPASAGLGRPQPAAPPAQPNPNYGPQGSGLVQPGEPGFGEAWERATPEQRSTMLRQFNNPIDRMIDIGVMRGGSDNGTHDQLKAKGYFDNTPKGHTTDPAAASQAAEERQHLNNYFNTLHERVKQGDKLEGDDLQFYNDYARRARSLLQQHMGGGQQQQQQMAQPPSGAVQMLKQNPKLAAAFDAKYGQGAARRILGQ